MIIRVPKAFLYFSTDTTGWSYFSTLFRPPGAELTLEASLWSGFSVSTWLVPVTSVLSNFGVFRSCGPVNLPRFPGRVTRNPLPVFFYPTLNQPDDSRKPFRVAVHRHRCTPISWAGQGLWSRLNGLPDGHSHENLKINRWRWRKWWWGNNTTTHQCIHSRASTPPWPSGRSSVKNFTTIPAIASGWTRMGALDLRDCHCFCRLFVSTVGTVAIDSSATSKPCAQVHQIC